MPTVSVVVPVYHNAASLPHLLTRLQRVAEQQCEAFEFVFVDDGSRDQSFEVLQSLAEQDPRVRAIKLTRNFGANAASSAGVSQARGDAVVAISADLQDPPELIGEMLARWRNGHRIVLAARSDRDDPWLVAFTSGVFWTLFRKFAVPTMPPHGCDYVLIDREVIRALEGTHEPNAGVGMILWTGFEPALVRYKRVKREAEYGGSMWSWSKRIGYLIDSFVSFSNFPVRAASVLGIALGLIGVLYALVVVVSILFFGVRVDEPGWPSLIVVILVVSGAQLLMTGIIGEYQLRTLEAARRRPPFIIERVVGGLVDDEQPLVVPSGTSVAAPGSPAGSDR